MERRGTRNGPSTLRDGSGTSRNEPTRDLLRFLQGMMENHQQKMKLLRQGLVTVPREQKPGNVSDFRRLQLAIFIGEEKPLDAEQWLIDTTDLLNAAHMTIDNQVEVAKIQFKGVARTW